MTWGRGERPRAEKHGLESPCTGFRRFCNSETSCFIVIDEFPMCFLRGRNALCQKLSVFGPWGPLVDPPTRAPKTLLCACECIVEVTLLEQPTKSGNPASGASRSLWEPLGSLWEPLGSLLEPLGASGSLWEAFGCHWVSLGAAGSLWEPLGAFIRANRAWYEVLRGLVRPMISQSSCFTRILLRSGRFSKNNGRACLVIYTVSVKYNGFGVVREFSALHTILLILGLKLMKTLCF